MSRFWGRCRASHTVDLCALIEGDCGSRSEGESTDKGGGKDKGEGGVRVSVREGRQEALCCAVRMSKQALPSSFSRGACGYIEQWFQRIRTFIALEE